MGPMNGARDPKKTPKRKAKKNTKTQNNFKWNPNIHLECVWILFILLKIKN